MWYYPIPLAITVAVVFCHHNRKKKEHQTLYCLIWGPAHIHTVYMIFSLVNLKYPADLRSIIDEDMLLATVGQKEAEKGAIHSNSA